MLSEGEEIATNVTPDTKFMPQHPQVLLYPLKELPNLVVPKTLPRGTCEWFPGVLKSRVWGCWLNRLRPRRPCALTVLGARGVPRKRTHRQTCFPRDSFSCRTAPTSQSTLPRRTTGNGKCFPPGDDGIPPLGLHSQSFPGILSARPRAGGSWYCCY